MESFFDQHRVTLADAAAVSEAAAALIRADLIESAWQFETRFDCPIHVVAVRLRPDAFGRRRVAGGRGRTPHEALAGAFAEAAERASAAYRGDEIARRAAYEDVADRAVDPRDLLLISERQYAERDAWNAAVGADHRLPARFETSREIAWVAARTADGVRRLVPAGSALLSDQNGFAEGFPAADSSGLAAGATLEAAIVRGFLELVERDAVAIWWYGQHPRPLVSMPSDGATLLGAPLISDFEAWLAKRGRRLSLLDLTHDVAIPVVAAVANDREGRDLAFGFAAGATTEQAAESAAGELLQFEITQALRRSDPHVASSRPKDWLDWCSEASLGDHAFLRPAETRPASVVETSASLAEMPETVEACAAACRALNLEPLTVDLTRPESGVPVVRVVVPGLRSIWPRFAPGRLYDVPVALGWQSRRVPEAALNPVPIVY